MNKIVAGAFDDNGGYDCMYGGIRVGRVVLDGSDYGQKSCLPITQEQLKAMQDDANLIADAFNVAAETGLTPLQLAEQRKELLAYAECEEARASGDDKTARRVLEMHGWKYDIGAIEFVDRLRRAAITKTKGAVP